MSRRIGIVLLAGLVGLAGLWPDRAQADEGRLGVGLCVPELPFSGAPERYLAARRVAQHLSRLLQRPVEGIAYLDPKDLRRDIRAGVLHFAVVGPLFAATMPEDQILAQGRLARSPDRVWSILCRSRRSLKDLEGKRLQIPRMGPWTLTFVQDGMLAGQVDVQADFKVQWSPDLRSAQQAVLLGRADAVVAPLSIGGLVSVLPGYAVPPPAFVLVDRQVPAKTVARAKKALLSFEGAIGPVRAWDPPDVAAYRKLAAFSRREVGMVLVPVAGIALDVGDLINNEVLLPGMPGLDEALGVR